MACETCDRIRLEREQLRARASVLMLALAQKSRHGDTEWAVDWLRRADEAASNVRLEDCVVAEPQ